MALALLETQMQPEKCIDMHCMHHRYETIDSVEYYLRDLGIASSVTSLIAGRVTMTPNNTLINICIDTVLQAFTHELESNLCCMLKFIFYIIYIFKSDYLVHMLVE